MTLNAFESALEEVGTVKLLSGIIEKALNFIHIFMGCDQYDRPIESTSARSAFAG